MSGRELAAVATGGDGDAPIELGSPLVGRWHPRVRPGHLVLAGDLLGDLEVLGQIVRVVAPAGAHGVVVEAAGGGRTRTPVAWGERLYRLDPRAQSAATAGEASEVRTTAADGGMVFPAPTSGRFYSRSGPSKPPFVVAGDELTEGQTVCLLEVMKTFHRVTYGGAGLPPRARVAAVLVADEADVAQGDPILRLEII